MKKYRLKKFNVALITFVILMYLEIVFRLITNITIFNISLLYVILYSIIVSLFISFMSTWLNEKVNKVMFYIFQFFIALIYIVQLCIYKMFGFYFDISLLS